MQQNVWFILFSWKQSYQKVRWQFARNFIFRQFVNLKISVQWMSAKNSSFQSLSWNHFVGLVRKSSFISQNFLISIDEFDFCQCFVYILSFWACEIWNRYVIGPSAVRWHFDSLSNSRDERNELRVSVFSNAEPIRAQMFKISKINKQLSWRNISVLVFIFVSNFIFDFPQKKS